jgi:hypothetical protein
MPSSQSRETATRAASPEPLSPCAVEDGEGEVHSAKRLKSDYTHDFKERFSKVLQNSEDAQNAWRAFRNARTACTIARGPCIKVYREFCEEYGGELQTLCREDKFEKLGSLSKCGCVSEN